MGGESGLILEESSRNCIEIFKYLKSRAGIAVAAGAVPAGARPPGPRATVSGTA